VPPTALVAPVEKGILESFHHNLYHTQTGIMSLSSSVPPAIRRYLLPLPLLLIFPYIHQRTDDSSNNNSEDDRQKQQPPQTQSVSSFTGEALSARLQRLSSAAFVSRELLLPTNTTTQYSICEAATNTALPVRETAASPTTACPPSQSWWRRSLQAALTVGGFRRPKTTLPRLVTLDDPALQVNRRLKQERLRDEGRLVDLQAEWQAAVRAKNAPHAQDLVLQLYETLYGLGVTPQARTDFLARYGCTAFTDHILTTLVELGRGRGFVELGAGHGQWARALTARAVQVLDSTDRPHDFCLAYDNASRLPLNPRIYHANTQAHVAYFGRVLPTGGVDPAVVLTPWVTRGRVLLLVYPPPDGSLAVDALRAYQGLGDMNDTLVYVGEGRGGATATPAFWEALAARGEWMLCQILPAQSCGSKADDKVFIFRRVVPAHPE
jgi:hypothetical protein